MRLNGLPQTAACSNPVANARVALETIHPKGAALLGLPLRYAVEESMGVGLSAAHQQAAQVVVILAGEQMQEAPQTATDVMLGVRVCSLGLAHPQSPHQP